MKFSIKDFFSKFDKIRRKKRIWSHLLKTSWMENFIFCASNIVVRVPAEVYLGPFETTTITLFFCKNSYGFLQQSSITQVWLGPKYA